MPNQRSKDKTFLGGFVDKKLHARLVRLAAAAGMECNKFGFATQLIEESLDRRKMKAVKARQKRQKPQKGKARTKARRARA